MISKITKIKNLGIFADYAPKHNLRDFKKYNLIYGWNGSGKTTFSKIFDSLHIGSHVEFPEMEYEIEDEMGVKYQHGVSFTQKIRVFNQDYIENNLKIREGKAKSITLVLGDVSKEVVEQIENDEIELKKKIDNLRKETEKFDQKEKTKNKTFTEIAKTIYIAITGGATRTYRKDNAEDDFILLNNKQILDNDTLDNLATTVKQNPKPVIDLLEEIKVKFTDQEEEISLKVAINKLLNTSRDLLSEKVDSIIINRIKENYDISDWVETGLKVHQDHNSKNCEFCSQPLPEDRIKDIARHFNEADKNLKKNLDDTVFKFSKIQAALALSGNFPDSARLYDELGKNYKEKCSEFAKEISNVLILVAKIQDLLKEKKSKTTESVDLNFTIDITKFYLFQGELNVFITTHNRKTTEFENEKNEAIKKLKNHYLSTIFDEVKMLEREIIAHKKEIEKLNNGDSSNPNDLGIVAIKNKISENRAKISSTHKACSDINTGLSTFLGRNELVFEPHKIKILDERGVQKEIDDGYVIMRNNKIVTHLSEGEKTAIAFVYFTIHLNDSTFDKANGIIVVDDPISSLDSNSLFQAFSFLKNSVKDAGQIFIMTHNFDFLRLILNWLQDRRIEDKDKSFYMIKNRDILDSRIAFLDELDKDLRKHESEYNYLFNILKTFQTDGTIASVYHMPNITRKVLESFLMFRVPNSQNPYQKMELLKPLFNENKITAIYKFTNDQSHVSGKGFDPCLVPETQKVVRYVLEFIEATFPEHYKILTTTV